MGPVKVHIHGSTVTCDLEVNSYEDLKKEIAAIEDMKNFKMKIQNKVIDERFPISRINGCHIDVQVDVSGELLCYAL